LSTAPSIKKGFVIKFSTRAKLKLVVVQSTQSLRNPVRIVTWGMQDELVHWASAVPCEATNKKRKGKGNGKEKGTQLLN
jgi:hypothetical protein